MTVAAVPQCENNFSFITEPEGEKYTFEKLYDLYAPPVYAWIQRFVTDTALADQILVNTFFNGWTNRHELHHSQVSPVLFLVRISNKDIEGHIGKTRFHEHLNSFLKGRGNSLLQTECAASEMEMP